MIILDTNVLSEVMRPSPDVRVLGWLNTHAIESLYFSTVSLAELMVGVAFLPEGRRKALLSDQITTKLLPAYEGRILAFGQPEARAYAVIVSEGRADGETIAVTDGQIAATAKVAGMAVATRDVRPFKVAGLTVLSPWTEG